MPSHARPAEADDLGLLVALYQDAVEELSVLRGGRVLLALHSRPDPVISSFRAQLERSDALVVVGTSPGSAGSGGSTSPGRASGSGTQAGLGTSPSSGAPPGHIAQQALAGYATARLMTLPGEERLASIDDLYVRPEHRRRGVGQAMASLVLDWCRAQGCSSVDAYALPGSRATKSFFESEHFTARVLVMHRTL